MGRTEISRIKDKLKRGTLSVFDIPEEFQNAAQIITLERKLSLREITRCGYDVISNLFFVEENLHDADEKGRILCSWFEKFAAYYDFLEGQIYHNACYAFFDFSEKLIKAYGLNLSELNRSALIEKTIDDYPLIPPMERETFLQGGNLLDLYKYWEERFNSCVTFEELLSVEKEFLKSELSNSVDSSFFLTQYVLKNYEREKNLAVCLMLVRKGRFFLDLLCFLTMKDDPESSKELLDCYYEYYVEVTEEVNQRQKKKIKEFILALEDGKIRWKSKVFYDVKSHLIVEKVSVYNEDYIRPVLEYYKVFSSFEEFFVYRKGDLTDCDFSKAYDLDIDFSNYKTDTSTNIPLNKIENPDYTVQKFYRDGKFYVIQQWSDNTGKVIRTNNHKFDFFFDFVFFLKGDLSEADLIMCDGLYILNGGTIKGLAQNDVQYYFENMDVMAEAVKSPLNKYSEFQKAIGATVRKIGGWGTIHGCIVDIDGYNHLYVNPFDGTVTPYYAVDMIQKVAYPSIQNLLEKNCPKLFANYSLLFEKGTEEITALTKYPRKPIVYLGTEMYRASREIKKMQKLYTNILSFWDDTVLHEKRIEEIDVKTGE